ncbi:MAG TPA: 30S ribosomal protein S24e [Thermoplasmata archaeon]|nr:30S ribosomal protein S24e [Thermoplasmata archaeon]HUJ77961.1 30S ribosomal protein S24e [Thermoplasmata archaeon]
MELRILEERPNPLLERTEYRFEVSHPAGATPTRDAVRTELAKVTKLPKGRIIVERMHAKFGTATTVGLAAGYTSDAALLKVVREHILVRNGLKEKAPAPAPGAEAAAAPAAPAAPAKEA